MSNAYPPTPPGDPNRPGQRPNPGVPPRQDQRRVRSRQQPNPQRRHGSPDPRRYQQPDYNQPGYPAPGTYEQPGYEQPAFQQPGMHHDPNGADGGYIQQWGEPKIPWWRRKLLRLPMWLWIVVGGFLLIAMINSMPTSSEETKEAGPTVAPATVAASGATTAPAAAAPLETEAPPNEAASTATTSPAPAFSMDAWLVSHFDLFTATTDEMNNFSAAANNIDLPGVERSGRIVSANMEILAKSLDNETDPAAVTTRNAFNSCSVAYSSAAEAASDIDVEGLEAASVLINGCSEALGNAGDAMGG